MTQISSHTLDIDAVTHTFYRHGLQQRLASHLTELLKAVWVGGLCISAILVIDATWPLGTGIRLAIGVGLLVAWVGAIWRLRPTRPDARQEALRNARLAEQHYALEGNPLINALSLAGQARRDGDDLAAILARRSVSEGWHTLESINLDALIDTKQLRRAWIGVAVFFSIWLMILWLVPRFLTGGLLRFADPFGDHPPFSFTQFSVTIDPSQTYVGDDVVVGVELTGRVPSQANLAQVNSQGGMVQRWPMRRMGQNRFERRLINIDKPISFWVEAKTGRSHRVDLVPASQPQTADKKTEPDAPLQPFDVEDNEGGAVFADDPHADRHTAIRLDELMNGAKRLQEYANELLGRVDQLGQEDSPTLDSVLTRLKHLNQRLEHFERRSRALLESLRKRTDTAGNNNLDDNLAQSLHRLADRLERMELTNTKPYDMRSVGHAIKLGGYGAASLDLDNLATWLHRIRSAASNDLIRLDQGQNLLMQGLAQAIGAADISQSSPGQELQTRRGDYDEVTLNGSTTVQTDAIIQSVPETYRHLVMLYFERLLQDQVDR